MSSLEHRRLCTCFVRGQPDRVILPPHIEQNVPDRLFALDADKFAVNLCFSRKSTEGGVSGMTNEHLRPLLENPRDMHTFFRVGELLARGYVPERVASILRG